MEFNMDLKEDIKEVVEEVKNVAEQVVDFVEAADLKVLVGIKQEVELLEAKFETAKAKLEHALLKRQIVESQVSMKYKMGPADSIDKDTGLISRK